jgi:preprotein translocase subunit SecG
VITSLVWQEGILSVIPLLFVALISSFFLEWFVLVQPKRKKQLEACKDKSVNPRMRHRNSENPLHSLSLSLSLSFMQSAKMIIVHARQQELFFSRKTRSVLFLLTSLLLPINHQCFSNRFLRSKDSLRKEIKTNAIEKYPNRTGGLTVSFSFPASLSSQLMNEKSHCILN